jgi:predicted unusual protein kinase regulating ubiquinone biosynthesis (AarF/ABC1/UbiB family)
MGEIPTSRIGRLARMAALGTRAGAGRLASALGSKVADAAVAAAAAEALGTMRGLALKLGQMASYVDGAVPEEHRATYEAALKTLRAAAPAMNPEKVPIVVKKELGARPEDLFATWEPEPFAAASIGQVHRATLFDGREVAVKVQYDGVARAVKSDLANASLFTALAGPLAARVDAGAQLAELRARFEEELDYAHEAAVQRRFARIFQGDPKIRIPAVIDDRSSTRVLTTTFATGIDFDAACAAPEDERRAWCETLWHFVFTSLLQGGLFNADPHPGNYLFASGGVIHFLDFGCARDLPPAKMDYLRATHRAAVAGDDDAFVEAAFAMIELADLPEQRRLGRQYLLDCFLPVRTRAPFRMSRGYTKKLFDDMVLFALAFATGKKEDFKPMPAEWLFFNRLQLGFYSVLARLDAEVDYAAIERQILDRVQTEGEGRG